MDKFRSSKNQDVRGKCPIKSLRLRHAARNTGKEYFFRYSQDGIHDILMY